MPKTLKITTPTRLVDLPYKNTFTILGEIYAYHKNLTKEKMSVTHFKTGLRLVNLPLGSTIDRAYDLAYEILHAQIKKSIENALDKPQINQLPKDKSFLLYVMNGNKKQKIRSEVISEFIYNGEKFVIHRATCNPLPSPKLSPFLPKQYNVSHYSTGANCVAGCGIRTITRAKKRAIEVLSNFSDKQLRDAIKSHEKINPNV